MQAPMVFIVHLFFSSLISVSEVRNHGVSSLAFTNASVIVGSYVGGLFASMIVYRLSPLHRLSQFPGPPLAAISKFWHVWQCRDSRNHQLMEQLHNAYGNFVRTGMWTFHRESDSH